MDVGGAEAGVREGGAVGAHECPFVNSCVIFEMRGAQGRHGKGWGGGIEGLAEGWNDVRDTGEREVGYEVGQGEWMAVDA